MADTMFTVAKVDHKTWIVVEVQDEGTWGADCLVGIGMNFDLATAVADRLNAGTTSGKGTRHCEQRTAAPVKSSYKRSRRCGA
jgi:hypothetical protein